MDNLRRRPWAMPRLMRVQTLLPLQHGLRSLGGGSPARGCSEMHVDVHTRRCLLCNVPRNGRRESGLAHANFTQSS